MQTCKHCGAEYSRKSLYCSKRCHSLATYTPRPLTWVHGVCEACDSPFGEWKRKTGVDQKFCSRTCRQHVEKSRVDPRARKRNYVSNMYGISLERYDELAANGCEVCGSFEALAVDHDHACCPDAKSCGACVRGVLCGPCNRAEGLLQSDPERMLALAAYLIRTSALEAAND